MTGTVLGLILARIELRGEAIIATNLFHTVSPVAFLSSAAVLAYAIVLTVTVLLVDRFVPAFGERRQQSSEG